MPTFPNYVRVKDKTTGVHLSVITDDDHPINEDHYQILKGDAVDNLGSPLPPEYPESLSSTPSGQKADTKKES
jgi:hypothetical protein